MFEKNVGTVDRTVRIVVGLALLVAFFAGVGGSWNWLFLIGIVPLVTGLTKTCPAYSLFGIRTCPKP
ncbi:DUF2892 domain-containing protein [Marivita sp. S0852]|uniref:YgaP family membrane protein n=1 Tax=Marivita sp. S0852 TaxID=3373893 RepID=UPI003982A626